MSEPTKTECDVSPFKSDEERKAFWAEHLATEKRIGEAAEKALAPWREYLAERASDRQTYRILGVVRKAVEASDFRGQNIGAATITIEQTRKPRKGVRTGAFSMSILVGMPGDRNFSSTWAHVGPRGAVQGNCYSGQLGTSRDF